MQRLLTLSLIVLFALPVQAQMTKIQKANGTVINPASEETLSSINSQLTGSTLTTNATVTERIR
jgi:hypothetical protein